MRRAIKCGLGLSMVSAALWAGTAQGAVVYVSTLSTNHLGGIDTVPGDILRYESPNLAQVAYNPATQAWSDSASVYFDGSAHFRKSDGTIGANEQIDAFAVRSDGKIILSVYQGARLGAGDPSDHLRDGGSKFDGGDLVLYDPATGQASLYFDGNYFRASNGSLGGPGDIDAFSLLSNGHLLFSTRGGGRIGSNLQEFTAGDLIEYDPATDLASLFFVGAEHFRKSDGTVGGVGNVNAVYVLSADELLLSVNTGERLGNGSPSTFLRDSGGQKINDEDVVKYTLSTKTAELYFHGLNFRTAGGLPGGAGDVDGLSLFPVLAPQPPQVAVPEPAVAALAALGLGSLAVAALRRRRPA